MVERAASERRLRFVAVRRGERRRPSGSRLTVLVGAPADVGVQTLAESSLFRIDAATLRWAAHRHRSDTIEMSRNGRPYTAGDIGEADDEGRRLCPRAMQRMWLGCVQRTESHIRFSCRVTPGPPAG